MDEAVESRISDNSHEGDAIDFTDGSVKKGHFFRPVKYVSKRPSPPPKKIDSKILVKIL